MSDPYQQSPGRGPVIRDREGSVLPWVLGTIAAAALIGVFIWAMSGPITTSPTGTTIGQTDRPATKTPPASPNPAQPQK